MIKFKDFQKLDIRVGTVVEAERVEGSNKLLRLLIDLGNEKRQLVSGIAKWYKPEDIINKQLTMVVNLEPREIMGLESQGMLLAVEPIKNAESDTVNTRNEDKSGSAENSKNDINKVNVGETRKSEKSKPIFLVPDEVVPNDSKVV